METKRELLEKIEYSESALANMLVYRKKLKDISNDASSYTQTLIAIEKSKKPLKEQLERKIAKTFAWWVGIYFVLSLVLAAFCTAIHIEIKDIPNVFSTAPVYIPACILIFVKAIKRIRYVKIEKPKLIEEYKEKIDEIEEQALKVENEIKQYAMTEEWRTAVSYIPKDYFYMSALEKMKFYLENGHADTMKEALRLYDEYVHRQKMEYEAKRAADNAAEASEYAKINAEQTESLKFWTEMNTFTNMAIYSKLS